MVRTYARPLPAMAHPVIIHLRPHTASSRCCFAPLLLLRALLLPGALLNLRRSPSLRPTRFAPAISPQMASEHREKTRAPTRHLLLTCTLPRRSPYDTAFHPRSCGTQRSISSERGETPSATASRPARERCARLRTLVRSPCARMDAARSTAVSPAECTYARRGATAAGLL